jgi:hypothetical protein
MQGYRLIHIAHGVVEVQEESVCYRLTDTQIAADLAAVRANRAKYASDLDWLTRVHFLESCLATARQNGKGDASPRGTL